MAIVTVGQVNDHLSNPPWSASQEADCQQLIDKRQAELVRWCGVPIEPVDLVEAVSVLDSGLLATTWPVYQVYEIDSVPVTDGLWGCVLPAPLFWRDQHWIARPRAPRSYSYTSRPFPLTEEGLPTVLVSYAGGWGPSCADITGAIIVKVAATMMNRHDDTVTTRALDDKTPPQLTEEWTDKELLVLKSRKRPVGA